MGRIMKDIVISYFLLMCLFPAAASAQSFEEYKRQQQAKYNSYVQKRTEEYKAYRDKVNAEYAKYMRNAWTREEVQAALPLPIRPEPPKPIVRKPFDIPQFDAIPFGDVKDLKKADIPKPEPIIPIDQLEQLVITAPENVKPEQTPKPQDETKPQEKPQEAKPVIKPQDEIKPEEKPQDVKPVDDTKPEKKPIEDKPVTAPLAKHPEGLSFKWCGLTWRVPLEKHHRFRLRSTKEADVAEAWGILSGTKYAGVVAECLKIRDAYQLPDWGYLHFLNAMTDAFLPGMPSEARLLEMFILLQSGYQARIGRCDGRLFLLVPSNGDIYEYSFLNLGGRKYYVTEHVKNSGSYFVFERDFPRTQPFVWQMSKLPLLKAESTSRTLQAQRFPDVQATVNISKNLVKFLNEYPRCNDWNSYALASLSEQAKASLYPALRKHIEGKSRKDAVGVLLYFVQTAFDYQADDQQFGEERPLFGDETLYYPYCDCEDRSILFSILVRELLGLDVVLLNYPEHLATAVCIGDDVEGDYLILDGRRFVVCDPTYIGGRVGEAMPSYKKTKATILRL